MLFSNDKASCTFCNSSLVILYALFIQKKENLLVANRFPKHIQIIEGKNAPQYHKYFIHANRFLISG
jgi:hypothetical protein